MPQSTLSSPRPMAARSASTFSTRVCALKFDGRVVMRSARRLTSDEVGSTGNQQVNQRCQHQEIKQLVGALARVHRRTQRLDHGVRAARGQHALGDELVAVELARAGMLTDLLVHQRLRQCRRVLFVVAQLAKAHDVHHDVLVELLAVVQRELRAQHDGFRIVAVDVRCSTASSASRADRWW